MSFNTFVAALVGFGLFFAAIALSTDNFMVFVSGAGFILVVGGTLAATFISYEFRYVIKALGAIASTFAIDRKGRTRLNTEVDRVIRWAYLVKAEGIVSLDAEVKKTPGWDGGFLRFGVELITTGYSGEEVKTILSNVIESTFDRNMISAAILRNMAVAAPAFGMVGTLIGLIIMLDKMAGDPGALGIGPRRCAGDHAVRHHVGAADLCAGGEQNSAARRNFPLSQLHDRRRSGDGRRRGQPAQNSGSYEQLFGSDRPL